MKSYLFFVALGLGALLLGGCSHIPSEEPVEKTEGTQEEEQETVSTLILEEPFKVGFMGPLTGDAASYGESIKRGVELARKEAGVEGIEVIYEDSKCDGKEAVNAINKLVTIDKVSVIIGEACSGATLASAPIAEQQKVVMISPASTSPKLSELRYVFRTVPSDALQGVFGAKFVYDKGYRKLAILYSNEEYGVGFEKILKEEFIRLKGGVVSSESVEREVLDVRTQLTKIKAAQPDALYIIINAPSTAVAALKQIKELDIKATIIGSEGLKSDEIVAGAGDAAEGLFVTSVSSGALSFATRHEKEYGVKPGPFAVQGYDAFIAVVRALETGARNGEEIRNALVSVNFEGASGAIDFDEKGDIHGNYDVVVVRNGQFVPFEEGQGGAQ